LLDEINLWCKVEGEGEDTLFQFSNNAPIPFSVVKDFSKMKRGVWRINSANNKYTINLADIIDYKFKTYNYSYGKNPSDQVVNLNEGTTEVPLYKERNFDIIKAAMFTDFIGVDDDKPNGLIQIEIWRKINVLSRRYGANMQSTNVGFFTSITPLVTFSKIENKNRRIVVDNWTDTSSGILLQRPFVRTIQLVEHANFYAGFSLNTFLIAIPDFKTNIYFNTTFGLGLTSLQDSVRVLENGAIAAKSPINFNTNLIQWSGDITVRFLEDARFGLWLKQGINYLYSTNNQVAQIKAENEFLSSFDIGSPASYWYLTTEVYANIKFSSASQMFARVRFHSQLGNINSNYFQAQLGFAFNIIGSIPFNKK